MKICVNVELNVVGLQEMSYYYLFNIIIAIVVGFYC